MRRLRKIRHTLAEVACRATPLLIGVMGLVNLFSAATPALTERRNGLWHHLPFEVRYGSHLATVLSGFALLILAQGLWRRKRVALFMALLVLLLSAVTNLVKGGDWEEASLSLALATLLFSLRRRFVARSDRPSLWHGIRVVALAFGFTLAYGIAGFYFLDPHFRQHFGIGAALEQTVAMFTEFDDPGVQPATRFGAYFVESIYVVATATFGYGLLTLLRPVLWRAKATPDEHARACTIVEAHGRSSLARVALLDDKSYFFTPGGSVVAYAVAGRVAVALGDPMGPIDDAGRAIRAFVNFCRQSDWVPSFYQTLPDYLPYYKEAGLDSLCIGNEAIVEMATFSTSGNSNKGLKSNLNRVKREGGTLETLSPPHSPETLAALKAVSDDWLSAASGVEKRFSLGWFDDAYLQDGPITVVRDGDGNFTAFANHISEYQLNEATIDLMRRRGDAVGGTMDALFVALFEWSKSNGYATFNLGLSPLAGVGETKSDPALERAIRFLYEHMNQFYNFKGLHAYKEKFRPRWEPRYLVYPAPGTLPQVALAVVQADSGEPTFWHFLNSWRVNLPRRDAKPSEKDNSKLRPENA